MLIPYFKEAKKRIDKNVNIVYLKDKEQGNFTNLGQDKTYFIKTYGCQMNEHDTENISAILENLKYTKTDDYTKADLIILNTCAIRENVHNKVFGMLGRVKYLKEARPNIILGLCGCMAQEEVVIDKILKKYKYVDFVFGIHNIHQLPNILNETNGKRKQIIEVPSTSDEIIECLPVNRDSKYKAWINIMYGCDNFCTYCIVPYTRGKQKSRLPADILLEINDLIKQGYQEVTLLGQNVNAYGKDFINQKYNFSDLLKEVAKTNIPRIRFVTSHPWDFNDTMINVIKDYKNIMPYIHLPVQSGSNKILKQMGRKYTKEQYLDLINKIRQTIPEVAISTDIIVGFPNETTEDFNETVDVVNQCQFDLAYTFIYSKKEGTPAAKMIDTVSKLEKENRLQELNKLVNYYAKQNNEKQVGKVLPVLIEGLSPKDNTKLSGYSSNFKLVNVKADKKYIGKIIDVKIIKAKSWSLDGKILSTKKVDTTNKI